MRPLIASAPTTHPLVCPAHSSSNPFPAHPPGPSHRHDPDHAACSDLERHQASLLTSTTSGYPHRSPSNLQKKPRLGSGFGVPSHFRDLSAPYSCRYYCIFEVTNVTASVRSVICNMHIFLSLS